MQMHDQLRHAIWAAIAGIWAFVFLWAASGPGGLDWNSLIVPVGSSCGLALMSALYAGREDKRIARTLEALAQVIAYTGAGALLSYILASWGGALWDDRFDVADLALGLDWRAYLVWLNGRPLLGQVLQASYLTLMPQMILAVVLLGFSGRIAALRVFVAATILSGVACIVISGAMPAMGTFVHYGLGPTDYPNLTPAASFLHVADLQALRDGSMTILSLSDAQGIITFPSYHAALAVIFAASFWQVRPLRLPGAALNGTMLAATPINGGHYFVDVIAGVLIAAAALWVVRQPFRIRVSAPEEPFMPSGDLAR